LAPVSEVLVDDQLAPLFGVCGKAVHLGGEYTVEQTHSPHGQDMKKDEVEGTGVLRVL
jgi:hypothetical protein